MSRNTQFTPEREPLQHHASLQLNSQKIHGPFSFLNPTQAHFHHIPQPSKADSETSSTPIPSQQQEMPKADEDIPASSIAYKWTSRNNRKGRHTLVVSPDNSAAAPYAVPPLSSGPKQIAKGIFRMFTCYPYWDVSWLVAQVFTWGSIIWVINAFFALLPYSNPDTDFATETLYGGGITAFIGATVFEIGSVLLMMEAVNENRTGCFGWALDQAYKKRFGHDGEGEADISRIVPAACSHHHQNKSNLVGSARREQAPSDKSTSDSLTDGTPPGDKSWVWWPSWHELRTHYFHDLGFIACSAQMFGATVFWISGFTALPGIYNKLAPVAVLNGVYWVPQVVGGTGFVVSGTLFMLETQKQWYQPALKELGWHIGLWNLIGGIGFTLCPIFGFSTVHWRELQASASTFWGSWAFLIGSVVQLYESLDKHPVEKADE